MTRLESLHRLQEALRFMLLPTSERIRKTQAAVGQDAPPWLDDLVWHSAKKQGYVQEKTGDPPQAAIVGTNGTYLEITVSGRAFAQSKLPNPAPTAEA